MRSGREHRSSDISSDILFGILSGISSGISSGILSGISSGILSGISSGTLSDISSGIGKSFPAGPHVGRYGTKNVQKKVRKNFRQVCDILLANLQVCGSVIGAMPLLSLRVAKFEAISLSR